MNKKFHIGNFLLSEESPAFIVAEAACNHMCQMDIAKQLIDKAAEAGANAIKFQTYKAEKLVLKSAQSYWSHPGVSTHSQFEYYKNLDRLGAEEYEVLFRYASEKGILAFSTPFDLDSATLLNDLGMPVFKIASCDLPDRRLLRHVARFGKPMILSTGASTLGEIEQAVKTLQDGGQKNLVLMVCTMSYPTLNSDAHLRRIDFLRNQFSNCLIGFSDHTLPDAHMVIPAVAVSVGARVIEKHYTLDRSMTGSGHANSVSPEDLKKMVENIRLTETVLGSGQIRILPCEETARRNARRSLVTERPIRKGEKILDSDIGIKRPCVGLSADRIDEVIGKVTKKDLDADSFIELEVLE